MTKEEQVIETIRKGPGMSPNEYQRLALRTASEESMKDPLLNGLLGLGGETGECQDLYKKHRFQGHELDKAKMAKELGDVSWYLALTALTPTTASTGSPGIFRSGSHGRPRAVCRVRPILQDLSVRKACGNGLAL